MAHEEINCILVVESPEGGVEENDWGKGTVKGSFRPCLRV